LLQAGSSDSLELEVDLDPSAPVASIELVVRESGVRVAEANTGAPIAVTPEVGADLPLSSGVLRLEVPSRRLEAAFTSLIPALLPPDGSDTPIALLHLSNDAPAGSGTIEVDSLRLMASDAAGNPLPIGQVASHLLVRTDGTTWVLGATLAPGDATALLVGASPIRVPAAGAADVELLVAARAGATGTRFRIGLDRSDIGVVQPQSSLLTIAVEAAAGNQFPFWSGLSSIAEMSLGASYSNYPNPFAAGRVPTTFVYVLDRASRVSLRIRTLRGELVRTLLEHVAFGAGLRQTDQWDGRNGQGQVVMNGVYVAELLVEPDGGPAERVLRKVAVVR
jgi:hypothetical protein